MVSAVATINEENYSEYLYKNCLIYSFVEIFKSEFNQIFIDNQNNKRFTIPDSLLDSINTYY